MNNTKPFSELPSEIPLGEFCLREAARLGNITACGVRARVFKGKYGRVKLRTINAVCKMIVPPPGWTGPALETITGRAPRMKNPVKVCDCSRTLVNGKCPFCAPIESRLRKDFVAPRHYTPVHGLTEYRLHVVLD